MFDAALRGGLRRCTIRLEHRGNRPGPRHFVPPLGVFCDPLQSFVSPENIPLADAIYQQPTGRAAGRTLLRRWQRFGQLRSGFPARTARRCSCPRLAHRLRCDMPLPERKRNSRATDFQHREPAEHHATICGPTDSSRVLDASPVTRCPVRSAAEVTRYLAVKTKSSASNADVVQSNFLERSARRLRARRLIVFDKGRPPPGSGGASFLTGDPVTSTHGPSPVCCLAASRYGGVGSADHQIVFGLEREGDAVAVMAVAPPFTIAFWARSLATETRQVRPSSGRCSRLVPITSRGRLAQSARRLPACLPAVPRSSGPAPVDQSGQRRPGG